MQVNNYQPNFKAARFDTPALELISKRVPSGQFDNMVNSFKDKYKDSKFEVVIGVLPGKIKRLDAMISFNNKGEQAGKGVFFEHIEEGLFKSMFSSPKKFLERVNEIYTNKAVPFESNGFKSYNA